MKKNHHITELISQGEHQQLDFKFEVSDSKKIARTLSAFANTDGGTLLIGVKDNGNIAGVRSEEEYYMIEAAAKMYCKPEISFEAKEWNMEGKIVLEITVNSLREKPCTAPDKNDNYMAYIRVGDENILASEVLVLAWKKQQDTNGVHLKISKPVEKLLAYLDKNQFISTNQFCKIARIKYPTARSILSDMLAIGSLGYVIRDNQMIYGIRK